MKVDGEGWLGGFVINFTDGHQISTTLRLETLQCMSLPRPRADQRLMVIYSADQNVKTTLWDDTSPQIRYAGEWAAGNTQLGKLVNATVQ